MLPDRLYWILITSHKNFKIANFTYQAVHLEQPLSFHKLLKLNFMQVNIRHNDQLLFQHPYVATNSHGHHALS